MRAARNRTLRDTHHVGEAPLGLVKGRLDGTEDVEEKGDTGHGKDVLTSKHFAEDQAHNGKLEDASEGSDDEAAADSQAEDAREDRIEYNEEEAETDIGPRQLCAGVPGIAVEEHVESEL